MKNYYPKLAILCVLLSVFSTLAVAQSATYGQNVSLRANATVSGNDIVLNWDVYSANVTSYQIYRRTTGAWPASPAATVSSSTFTYTDTTVSSNTEYEYKVVGTQSGTDAIGYVFAAIELDETTSKGHLAVVIDTSLLDDLSARNWRPTKKI